MTERIWDSSGHRHGRWTGLFKLAEECGELVIAAIDVAEHECEQPFAEALEDELGDVMAAARHVSEANRLDMIRMNARIERQVAKLNHELDMACFWPGRDVMIRRAGVLVQLLGKIAAFPEGTEHPDGFGNLVGRLEVAIADLLAIVAIVIAGAKLDDDRIRAREAAKLALFRTWFPFDDAQDRPAQEEAA